MMRDEILFGNVLGLLKTGKWNMNAQEAVALIQIIQELERRRLPPASAPVVEPITKPERKNKNAVNK